MRYSKLIQYLWPKNDFLPFGGNFKVLGRKKRKFGAIDIPVKVFLLAVFSRSNLRIFVHKTVSICTVTYTL